MRKLLLFLITILPLTSTIYAQTLTESIGSINFIGTITTASCSLTANDVVELGSISTRTLKEAGTSSSWVPTDIRFYNCDLKAGIKNIDGISSVLLEIEQGQADPDQTNLWVNRGDATNVGLELQITNKLVMPAGALLDPFVVRDDRFVVIPLRARMTTTTTSAGAGSFKSRISFRASYK